MEEQNTSKDPREELVLLNIECEVARRKAELALLRKIAKGYTNIETAQLLTALTQRRA